LGDKRKELTPDAINQITELYSSASEKQNDPRVKLMTREEFGYARITVERPLRRVWKVDDEILSKSPDVIRPRLEKLKGQFYKSQKDAEHAIVSAAIEGKDLKLAMRVIAATDSKADAVPGKKYLFEADSDLRDFENMRLPAGFIEMSEEARLKNIELLAEEFLLQEIQPFIQDAWIDHSKTKIGYEIPFTRQFYKYTPPREISEIRRELEALELQIQDLMRDLE
jgi:type I restriction enzyme M protein